MNRSKQIVESYLNSHGIINKREREEILSGFDLNKPLYENRIWPGDKLFQFVRNPNSEFESKTGRWFFLQGATMNALSIFSGGSGRQLKEFKVKYPIVVLEGTAKEIPHNWNWAGGGKGGASQLFIPERFIYNLEVIGTHL